MRRRPKQFVPAVSGLETRLALSGGGGPAPTIAQSFVTAAFAQTTAPFIVIALGTEDADGDEDTAVLSRDGSDVPAGGTTASFFWFDSAGHLNMAAEYIDVAPSDPMGSGDRRNAPPNGSLPVYSPVPPPSTPPYDPTVPFFRGFILGARAIMGWH
jgi:hypothetical protein